MTTKTKSETTAGKESFSNVQDLLVKSLGKNDALTQSVNQRIHSRKLVKKLIIARSQAKLSQADLARKLDCSQSRISKIENGSDDQLRVADLSAYSKALDTGIMFSIGEPKRHAVESIKHHAFQIKHHLDQLASLAQKDEQISTGVEDFFSETLFNMLKIIEDSARKLPTHSMEEDDILIYSNKEIEQGQICEV
ncbi:helix-turn-helix domain-containing protein [Coraliomargarita sp. SDUM461004]|uniref:Helix-turn-helix domain-containing protein n=1 Tax=Thalassobacterium sedimentorum TaxID=3041258 RepID=A0ABU1AM15_9BACT|nr:helix-turn-helix domain-containing protein [Coraliomargarita sp. SDUM461004]MDQ8195852.1 helix-turn-helix domain-containing protein [Coraliomargarita sp. SDUM461004]